ncbi:C39 family peptidase [Mycobacterium sp. M23085]|uniref:C39 family peptidase n=1 Tax=Mycobacterium sp. M23085 TaxID=3378087 RepID=UPI003877DAA5
MTSTVRARVATATQTVLVAAAAAVSPVILAAGVHANPGAPVPDADHELGMYGDPVAAAPYWRQQSGSDCGEMAVADVVGQITGRQPTEQQMIDLAENTPGATHHGPIWQPKGTTDIADLPILLWHYRVRADNIQTDTDALARNLAQNHKVIAIVNAETIWNRPGKRNIANHFVVVTGIDSRAGVVHLNDSGISTGRDEQIPISVFERAWAPNYNSAIVTK